MTTKRVCVTGASGFIALHLCEHLLKKGYHVVAAVRGGSSKLAPLQKMLASSSSSSSSAAAAAGSSGSRLEIVENCELMRPGAFDEAVRGCETVFHTASPFWMDDRITDPAAQLVAPAEQGTLNVLRSCEKSGSVERVVVTSSFAAMMNVGGRDPWPADFEYNETHWNVSSA
jgi:nucleoside-diphosphate-sugar epimerase